MPLDYLRFRPVVLAPLLLATSLVSVSANAFTPASTANPTPNTLYFRLNTPIALGDAAKFESMLTARGATPGKTTIWVHMNAKGGDLNEAMRVGRVFRKYNVYATHGYCYGSCVFAYMGARMRYYTPPKPHMEMSPTPPDMTGLWVYEPYVMATALPLAKTNPRVAKALQDTKDYVVEMTGIPKFYDSVIKIPHAKPVRMSSSNVFDMNVGSLEANGQKPTRPGSVPVGNKPPGW